MTPNFASGLISPWSSSPSFQSPTWQLDYLESIHISQIQGLCSQPLLLFNLKHYSLFRLQTSSSCHNSQAISKSSWFSLQCLVSSHHFSLLFTWFTPQMVSLLPSHLPPAWTCHPLAYTRHPTVLLFLLPPSIIHRIKPKVLSFSHKAQ